MAERKSGFGTANERSEGSEGARKLLAAAERLFAERGFDSVSVADISELAGVSKGNLFHHFKSKKNLYLAALNSAGMRTTSNPDQDPDSSPVQRLQVQFGQQLNRLTQDSQATRLVLRELLDHGSEHSKELAEEIYAEAFAHAVSQVREGQQEGQLRDDFDPGLLAFVMLATNVFYFQAESLFKFITDATFVWDPESYNEVVFDLLLNGAVQAKR